MLMRYNSYYEGKRGLPIVRPVHLRTAKNGRSRQQDLVDPLGYLEFNYLMKHVGGVITDSGDITEETSASETITIGTNELIGTDPSRLPLTLVRSMAGHWKTGTIPPKWDRQGSRADCRKSSTLTVSEIASLVHMEQKL